MMWERSRSLHEGGRLRGAKRRAKMRLLAGARPHDGGVPCQLHGGGGDQAADYSCCLSSLLTAALNSPIGRIPKCGGDQAVFTLSGNEFPPRVKTASPNRGGGRGLVFKRFPPADLGCGFAVRQTSRSPPHFLRHSVAYDRLPRQIVPYALQRAGLGHLAAPSRQFNSWRRVR